MRLQAVRQYRHGVVGLAACALLLAAASSGWADNWNDRTILKFDEPVRVPGATLQPGSYVFQLADAKSTRHTVQILRQDGATPVAMVQAVPMKRLDTGGDLVVKLYPGDANSPAALKGWFYPGSMYGHEFVYPEDEARQIAQRAKTIVLAVDVPGTDLQKGTLRTYDGSGNGSEWRADAAMITEWDDWQRGRHGSATVASEAAQSETARQASAPAVRANTQGTRVKVDQLEDNPAQFMGKTISVDAEVEDVYGPRLFTIDEPNWGDLEGEILVYMPTALAALVRENDRVTITGTVKPFVRAEVEREWGWLDLDPALEVNLAKKPVLVASRIVGGNDNRAMLIEVEPSKGGAQASGSQTGSQASGSQASGSQMSGSQTSGTQASGTGSENRPVGTSGSAADSPVTEVSNIANGDEDLVGRKVHLNGLTVQSAAKDSGFVVKTAEGNFFVLPSSAGTAGARAGDVVSVKGYVLQLPRGMREHVRNSSASTANLNEDIYVYATEVTK